MRCRSSSLLLAAGVDDDLPVGSNGPFVLADAYAFVDAMHPLHTLSDVAMYEAVAVGF
jgi:hypothetical protein